MKYFWLIASLFSFCQSKDAIAQERSVVASCVDGNLDDHDHVILAVLLREYGINDRVLRGSFEEFEALFQTIDREHSAEQ